MAGGFIVTNKRYGPAVPSKYTSGLPTCASLKGLTGKSKRSRTNLKICIGTSLARTIAAPALTTGPAHRVSPQDSETRRENRYHQRDQHADPEFHPRLLVSSQRPGQVIFGWGSVVAELIHGEDPVACVRRHQEVREGPAHGHCRDQESAAARDRFVCVAAAGQSEENKVECQRTREDEHRKAKRYHVSDDRKHRTQFCLCGKQRENPIPGKPPDRIHCGDYCASPTGSGHADDSN